MSIALLVVSVPSILAEPQPGDLFREYRWTNRSGDAGGSLRVGGRLDYGGDPIHLDHHIDLDHAIRAEVIVEKLLCHDGTRGLAISVNNHSWIELPEASGIPTPQWEYQHHTYPVASIPLGQLKAGSDNQFRLRVDEEHPWQWPQNLIYGVHFRIYYDSQKKPHPTGKLIYPLDNAKLGASVRLQAKVSSSAAQIDRIDFLGRLEDVNLEGDGLYTQWHYHYVRSELVGHIGSRTKEPWSLTWGTSWIPDQPNCFQLAIWITDETGLVLFSESVRGLTLDREGFSVELCKPFDLPRKWVTRRGEHQEKFQIRGDLSKAVAARLAWCSWSPGYMEGIYINGQKVFDREGPHYAYYVHQVPLEDLSVLKAGENLLKTGKTPRHNGKMVHGTEINWPGIMILIKYRK